MGIDYSSTAGYGFAVKSGDESKFLMELYDADAIYDYVEKNYPGLGYSHCGNMMGDESYHFFYIDSLCHTFDLYEGEPMYEFDGFAIDRALDLRLGFLKDALDAGSSKTSWKLFTNTS